MTAQYEKSLGLHKELLQSESIKKHLGEIKNHHKESYEHSVRVGLLCIDLAYENELSDDEVRLAGESGLLHDLGKSSVSKEILSKDARLNDEEREEVNGHPRNGFIKMNGEEYDKIRRICIAHHEYKKGKYPRSGNDRRKKVREESVDRRNGNNGLSKIIQIVAIADMFDALTSRRAYKKAFPKSEVEKIIREQFTGDEKFIKQVMKRI
ncbi:HD-GYP domain-containing protein [Patescibacteria group bacterium]